MTTRSSKPILADTEPLKIAVIEHLTGERLALRRRRDAGSIALCVASLILCSALLGGAMI